MKQALAIVGWHPTMNPNGSHLHWSTAKKKHDADMVMAWASAKQAKWQYVPGKVKLSITLVYPRKYRVDADNLAARCKGMIDGLKGRGGTVFVNGVPEPAFGYFKDDSTEWLDLEVGAEVEKGTKEVRISMESVR